ncbi:hypothetical protein AAVH_22057 [Aphelenchoides avenae]|nr:hypothetical protein AAVH_22057 [Aphelenchus avenae]
MKALLLFLAFAACVYAHCPAKEYWHRYYYVRGKAKVKLRSQEVTEGLRVEFVSNSPYDPKNVTVLAGANADDQGRYVVAVFGGCYPDETYGLRLYADSLAPYPLDVGHDQDQLEVPRNCEYLLGQPVKDCKTDIVGQLKAP